MTKIAGKKILITGGAGGIGRLMVKEVLNRGAERVYLWDILDKEMDEFRSASPHSEKIVTRRVDVSKKEQLVEGIGAIGAENVDILINNAGVVTGREFCEHTHQDIDRTMAINTNALMHLTLLVMPAMQKRGEGHIVNIASAAGLIGNPRMSVYAASKWAVIGWSDSVRLELEKAGSPLRITTVTPSYIDTEMFKGVKTHAISPVVKPEQAAKKVIRGIERNKIVVRMPASVYLLPIFKGLLPIRWFDVVVGRFLRVYRSMDGFKGKN
ncbi:MAG: SDR family NAD(P)-dependent oxidoreductase [Saprospirales bacterium]|nr:MAG: SDR family NAD(P)-dependent oxidoreductase [Saprospirales bacterium]